MRYTLVGFFIRNKIFILACCLLAVGGQGFAQLPTCSGASAGLIYYIGDLGDTIYNFDPTQPISATNPVANTIVMPATGAVGISLGPNLNAAGTAPAMAQSP